MLKSLKSPKNLINYEIWLENFLNIQRESKQPEKLCSFPHELKIPLSLFQISLSEWNEEGVSSLIFKLDNLYPHPNPPHSNRANLSQGEIK